MTTEPHDDYGFTRPAARFQTRLAANAAAWSVRPMAV